MRGRKGFTLIELMIVIVIVAILAAIVVPLLLSRVKEAKYSEGKAILSQVATVLRAHAAENGSGSYNLSDMKFQANELDAKYFDQDDITDPITVTVNTDGTLTYTISIKSTKDPDLTDTLTLTCTNNNSVFSQTTPSP